VETILLPEAESLFELLEKVWLEQHQRLQEIVVTIAGTVVITL